MERDAKYAAVAIFALLSIASAVAFVWWYSGRGDRRDYDYYEIYFNGSVSGLARASPIRYLGVDVGRVRSLSVDKLNPGRVKVIAAIDSTAPISRATLARLGLLGLTGLLYIDLQLDEVAGAASEPLPQGEEYPVINSRKGDIEEFVEKLPDAIGRAAVVMERVGRLLSDENLKSVHDTLANLHEASTDLPAVAKETKALAADLQRTARQATELAAGFQQTVDRSQPDLQATLGSVRTTAERLSRTADSLDRIVVGNEGALAQFAGSAGELQQLVIDARDASAEVRALARSLRENPSSLLRERPETGVEVRP